MADPFVRCSFPGVVSVIRFSASIGHGETPGVFLLEIVPQPSPPALIGTLTIEFAGEVYSWPDCRAVAASYRRDGSGRVVALTIEDWRWRWRFGAISGRYNVREPQAATQADARKIISHTEKTPRELAVLCFEQLGQTSYDVSRMPDDARPEIEWDVEPAAQALASLCDALGCRIVPYPKNHVKILPLGEGGELPQHPSRTDLSEALDPPERPSYLAVVGGPALFQHDFEIEWLAEETDGEYVLLDDVSYKPTLGWAASDPEAGFASFTDKKLRKLAQGSVYRVARIKIPSGGLHLPGYSDLKEKKIARVDQLIVLDHQLATETQHGVEVYTRPWLYGAFTNDDNVGDDVGANTVTKPEPIVDRDSDLAKKCTLPDSGSYDQEKGILRLGEMVFYTPTVSEPPLFFGADAAVAGTRQPAKLRWRVAVMVRDEDTGAIERYIRKREYGTPPGSDEPTAPEVIRREEITFRTIPVYDTRYNVTSIEYYRIAADKEADYYLDQREKEWRDLTPSEASYAWIIPLQLDGAIQHVVYSGGVDQPAVTRISRNNEMKKYITPYKERRRNEQVRGMIARFVAANPNALRPEVQRRL